MTISSAITAGSHLTIISTLNHYACFDCCTYYRLQSYTKYQVSTEIFSIWDLESDEERYPSCWEHQNIRTQKLIGCQDLLLWRMWGWKTVNFPSLNIINIHYIVSLYWHYSDHITISYNIIQFTLKTNCKTNAGICTLTLT